MLLLCLTCNAWMSKMTMLVGPPLLGGMFDRMRAKVKAVATSPSVSTCARECSTSSYGSIIAA